MVYVSVWNDLANGLRCMFQERIVHVKREKVGGLGLSVKGGAEHNLPILVSRIFKDQAGR